jgi:hypothetical protein
MESDFTGPVNIGSEEMVTINRLAEIAIKLSGKNLTIKNVDVKQKGVRGRNSDNKLIKEKLGWEPNMPLEKGMDITYQWINEQVNNNYQINELIFNNVYATRKWGHFDKETYSGSGSTIEANHYRNIFLSNFINENNIEIVYDICGDCNWQYNFVKMVNDEIEFEFFGFDISTLALNRAKEKNINNKRMIFR